MDINTVKKDLDLKLSRLRFGKENPKTLSNEATIEIASLLLNHISLDGNLSAALDGYLKDPSHNDVIALTELFPGLSIYENREVSLKEVKIITLNKLRKSIAALEVKLLNESEWRHYREYVLYLAQVYSSWYIKENPIK